MEIIERDLPVYWTVAELKEVNKTSKSITMYLLNKLPDDSVFYLPNTNSSNYFNYDDCYLESINRDLRLVYKISHSSCNKKGAYYGDNDIRLTGGGMYTEGKNEFEFKYMKSIDEFLSLVFKDENKE